MVSQNIHFKRIVMLVHEPEFVVKTELEIASNNLWYSQVYHKVAYTTLQQVLYGDTVNTQQYMNKCE